MNDEIRQRNRTFFITISVLLAIGIPMLFVLLSY